MKSRPGQNGLRYVGVAQVAVKEVRRLQVCGGELAVPQVDVIEKHSITLAHSEVDPVELACKEADVLQTSMWHQRARHTTIPECDTREGCLLHICAREVTCLHQDIHKSEMGEVGSHERGTLNVRFLDPHA